MVEDDLRLAVAEVLEPLKQREDFWEQGKLEKRIREYFRKAARGLDFHDRPWHVLLNELADFVFASLFQALGDRSWLARADFVLCLDAAARETFPPRLLAPVPRPDFERAVLAAHDRAFEEQRYLPMLWGLIRGLIPRGGKSGKKIYDAFEFGRRCAIEDSSTDEDPNQIKAFVSKWTDCAIAHLSKNTLGDPASVLPEPVATRLLHALLEAGALPVPLSLLHGQPPGGWPFVDYAVHAAYLARGGGEGHEARPQAKPRPRPKPREPATQAESPPPPATEAEPPAPPSPGVQAAGGEGQQDDEGLQAAGAESAGGNGTEASPEEDLASEVRLKRPKIEA